MAVTGHFILTNGVSVQSSFFFLMLGIKRVLNRYPWCCPMTAISWCIIKIDCITSKNYRYEKS